MEMRLTLMQSIREAASKLKDGKLKRLNLVQPALKRISAELGFDSDEQAMVFVAILDRQCGCHYSYHRHISPTLGDRITVQADKAELPTEVLLWRKRKRYQEPALGDTYRQPVADGDATRVHTLMELLKPCDDGKDKPDALR